VPVTAIAAALAAQQVKSKRVLVGHPAFMVTEELFGWYVLCFLSIKREHKRVSCSELENIIWGATLFPWR
jgi:hypothetical protein